MQTQHLDTRTLSRLQNRELSLEDEERWLDHLSRCASCRSLVNRALTEDPTPAIPDVSAKGTTDGGEVGLEVSKVPRAAYSRVVEKSLEFLVTESDALESERGSVAGLVEELESLEQAQQRLVIRNSSRYQSWALVEGLLDRCRTTWSDDPRRSERLAELALEITGQLEFSGFRSLLLEDLKAEAWSYVGNCLRIQSDLYGAEKAFRSARECLHRGSGDLLAAARLSDLESSLRRAKRDFDGAERLLVDAVRGYRRVCDRHMEGRVLLNLANLLRMQGRLEESVRAMEASENLIDVASEPSILFALKENMLVSLVELDRTEEARALLPEVRELARAHGSRLDRLRLRWAEGLLYTRLGQVEIAEELLKQVREGFIIAGIGYNAALVSLDIAALCLKSGRLTEVRELARETYPLFTSRGVHREALTAWNLFRQAAEQDAVTVRLLEEVASRIRKVKGAPSEAEGRP